MLNDKEIQKVWPTASGYERRVAKANERKRLIKEQRRKDKNCGRK
jgi:hypothetical protein